MNLPFEERGIRAVAVELEWLKDHHLDKSQLVETILSEKACGYCTSLRTGTPENISRRFRTALAT